MQFLYTGLTKAATFLIAGLSLSIGASSQVEQIEQLPSDRQERGQRGAATSGRVMVEPISLVFTAMDANGDAVVSDEELTAGIQSQWENFGGSPGPLKFMDWSLKHLGSTDVSPRYLSFDTNFDSIVSEAEFSNRLAAEFDRIDKNADGLLERSEMIKTQRTRGGRQSRGDGEGAGEGREGRRGGRGGRGGGDGGGRP